MAALLNIPNWQSMTLAARKRIQSRATVYVRSRIKRVFEDAIRVSPQWSGNFAANWNIETNAFGTVGYNKVKKVDPWQTLKWWDTGANNGKVTDVQKDHNEKYKGQWARYAGDTDAIKFARGQVYEKIADIKWNTKVKLVNKSPIADQIEDGSVKLRRVNMVHGTLGVLAYLKSEHHFLE